VGQPRIFISAAEPSGDRHAAALIRQILNISPKSTFFGVAGPLMQATGCQPIDDFTGRSAMLLGALRLAHRAYNLDRRIRKILRAGPVDLAILVDSPALHLPMAKHAKTAGCPVLYYIAPQLWAWAPWRIGRLRRRVDQLAAILPFEESYFRDRGLNTRYVGHPLIEQLAQCHIDQQTIQALKNLGQPAVACLPGSRSHVIKEVLPGQIQVAQAIANQHPDAVFIFSAANQQAGGLIRAHLDRTKINSHILIDHNEEILSAADLALCASGTATLEVAYHQVPMVVMYNGSKWGYRFIGRWLINTPYLSLVNILANKKIVPEFMPYYTSTKPIIAEALDLLTNQNRRATTQTNLKAVIDSLGTTSAAQQTAQMAMDMIDK
jgi:lipid-A-disaccharide synthase